MHFVTGSPIAYHATSQTDSIMLKYTSGNKKYISDKYEQYKTYTH